MRSINGGLVNVGQFESFEPGLSQVDCRLVGPLKPPDGQTFADYIRGALISELKVAEAYSEAAPVTLTGRLNSIDLGSMSGFWALSVTFDSSNGKSITIDERYEFEASFFAEPACAQSAQALMPAVQDTIKGLIHHPEFSALIGT